MRILGIDYGEARVGVAITDALNITAQGLETIQRNNSDKIVLRRLDEILEQYEIDNTHLYNDKAGMETRNMDDLIEAILGIKPQKRNSIFRKIFERFSIFWRKR